MGRHVLFLCTGNSCRSQMAEGFFRAMAPPDSTVESAGTNPIGVHPRAVAVMAEIGIDISAQRSKGITPGMYARASRIVVVCSHANARCPVPPPGIPKDFWDIHDPASLSGGEAGVMDSFRRVREEIRELVEGLVRGLAEEKR